MADHLSDIERLINQGRFFEARIVAENGLKINDSVRVRQLLAMAMNKSGLSEPARDILEPVHRQDSSDPETAGILGSIYKRLFKKTQDNKFAVLARTTYQQNFSVTKNYYTGINTASMAAISGKGSEGRAVAKDVIAMLDAASEDFWEQATLGEAFLLSRDNKSALQHYLRARKMAGKEWGKLQSVYDQLLLLNFFIPIPSEILKAFAPPGVIAFTGHMVDRPDRAIPRFPASIEKSIKEGIASAIRTVGANIGYCSLACGSDILFAEAMAEAGGEVHLFLPFNREDYIRESVAFAGEQWVERFEALEKAFPVTYVTHEPYSGNDDLFSFQNRVILGTVVLRAATNFTTPTLLTVLSGTDVKSKEGGTRDTLNMWPYKDHHINVNPDNFIQGGKPGGDLQPSKTSPAYHQGRHMFYVVMTDLPDSSAGDSAAYSTFAVQLKEHLFLKPQFDQSDGQYCAAFNSPAGAMELVRSLSGFRKGFGNTAAPRISLHCLMLNSSENKFEPSEISEALSLHKIAPPGIPSGYGWFASSTVLSSDTWTMEFAGIAGDSHDHPNEIYSVVLKK